MTISPWLLVLLIYLALAALLTLGAGLALINHRRPITVSLLLGGLTLSPIVAATWLLVTGVFYIKRRMHGHS